MSEKMDPSRVNSIPELNLRSSSEHKLPKLHAMGFGELLDTTFSLYRAHFRSFVAIASGYFIVMLVGVSIVFFDDSAGRTGKIVIWIPTFAIIFGGFVFIISSLISASAQAYLAGTVGTGAALKQGIRHFLPCFISSLVFGLLAILLVFVLTLSYVALYISVVGDKSWDPIYGGLLMVIIIWVAGLSATYWCIFASAILVEGKSIRESLRRGRDLIRGIWWRIAGMVLAIFLLSFAIGFILRAIFGFLLILTGLTDEGFVKIFRMGIWELPVTRRGLDMSNALVYIINFGVDTITMPIWVIGGTLLYFNQRIRKEGFDIEMMATRQGE